MPAVKPPRALRKLRRGEDVSVEVIMELDKMRANATPATAGFVTDQRIFMKDLDIY